jgi:hypothetical protein
VPRWLAGRCPKGSAPPGAAAGATPPRARSGQGTAAGQASSHERAATLDRRGSGVAPARPARHWRAGRGVQGPREPARSAAADPRPGGRRPPASCLPWVDGGSVSLSCSGADQGGRHVGMVVGADHRGRCGSGVWPAAKPSPPLTALRQRPGHGRLSRSTRTAGGRRCGSGRPIPENRVRHGRSNVLSDRCAS